MASVTIVLAVDLCDDSCMPAFFFFFLMLRRPPRSTLFPTRRSSDLGRLAERITGFTRPGEDGPPPGRVKPRSEEHTSELQSRENLVCRLLLEKKKNAINQHCARDAGSGFGRFCRSHAKLSECRSSTR